MTHHYVGGCLCGAVRFEIQGEFDHFFLCHCQRCRKDTGSAHGANLFASQASLNWLAGESDVKTFNLPETRHSRSFCSHCGSALPGLQMDGQLLVVPAGSLETDVPMPANGHLFVASRANWDKGFEDLPKFETLPE